MSIIQGLIASINNSAGGGGGGGSSFTPVDSTISLGLNWTVEIIGSFTPTSFWATMWGNEVWFAGTGHLAFLTSTTSLSVGGPNSTNDYSLADDVSVKSYWVFTHADGGGLDVYRNGVLLTPSGPGYSQPNDVAPNTLLFGARHNNDGTGSTDLIGSATYFYTNIQSQAQDSTWVDASYQNLKGPYGLP